MKERVCGSSSPCPPSPAMARTKQTARMSAGGKAPRKTLQGAAARSRGKQLAVRQQLAASKAFVEASERTRKPTVSPWKQRGVLDAFLSKCVAEAQRRLGPMQRALVEDTKRRLAMVAQSQMQLEMVRFIIQTLNPDAKTDDEDEEFFLLERYNTLTQWVLYCFLIEQGGRLTKAQWVELMDMQNKDEYDWDTYDRGMFSALYGRGVRDDDLFFALYGLGITDDDRWDWFVARRDGVPKGESMSAQRRRESEERRRARQERAELKEAEKRAKILKEMDACEREARKRAQSQIPLPKRANIKDWNKYAMQYCLDTDIKTIEADRDCRREFCDGLSSAQLLAQVRADRGMEFRTPEAYAELQVERVPGNDKVPKPFEHLPKRKGPQPDGAFSHGPDADVSLGWACLASWYYDRHEGVIERCWKAYDAFKRAHGDRTIDKDDVPFVLKDPYKGMQYESDEIELVLAPERYQEILNGLNVVALFLGNRWDKDDIMDRFQRALKSPPVGRVPNSQKNCKRRNGLPSYFARDAEARYFPVAEFVQVIFKTAPATGGPNWDNGVNPAWKKTEFEAHEGRGASWRKLSEEESQQQRVFCRWLGKRKGEMDYTLRLAAGLCLPRIDTEGAEAEADWEGAKKLLDALWDFLAVHAWPVHRRWTDKRKRVPFASIRAHHKRWFRDVHYDEYDRWAHLKWAQSYKEAGTRKQKVQMALPDLYTLMKRRHKLAIEADECREEAHAFATQSTQVLYGPTTYAEWRANGYAKMYETDGEAQNVRRPSSGGRSYGAGAYTALKHDPYCTFGRQRGRSHVPEGYNELKYRTPAEAPRTEWPTVRSEDDCNFCADDASMLTFPEPPKPPDPPKRQQRGVTLPLTKSKKLKNGADDDDDFLFDAPAERSALRLCRTRFRVRMTKALLGHRRRAAEAPAI